MTAPQAREMPAVPDAIRHVHIIGICGTAMGPLAAMLRERGYTVQGSDRMAYPPMSTWLNERGIQIHIPWQVSNLTPRPDLVIVGNVCRRDNPEAVFVRDEGIVAISLPEALRHFFLVGRVPMVVTGTHGKTTTCALLSWLLESAGRDPSFFIGGVTGNFGSNYKLGQGAQFVVEGDEYDTAYFDKVPKFWHYCPGHATINNIEFDHGDIYADIDEIQMVFGRFAELLPPDGTLWINGEDPRCAMAARRAVCRVKTFGLERQDALSADHVRFSETGATFEVHLDGAGLGELHSPLIGEHNVRNVLGAVGMALTAGVEFTAIQAALPLFRGVVKRQQVKGIVNDIIVIDDYAHHPTAVRETLRALRNRYPNRRLWAAFEAKSNTSRSNIFQHDYPKALCYADQVVFSAIWHSSTLPEEQRIDLPRMVQDLKAADTQAVLIPDVEEIVDYLVTHVSPGDVVVGLSGSNFGGLHDKLVKRLKERFADAERR